MPLTRRCLIAAGAGALAAGGGPAWASGVVTVAFAGSMGVVMDQGLSPAFAAKTGIAVHGIGEAAMAIAHLLVAKSMAADVFVSVSAGPVKVVEQAGLSAGAVPVASTEMVLAYAPTSRFAPAFAKAGAGGWVQVLTSPGLRFGRTDPTVDPQGAYVLYALQLAEIFYQRPGLASQVAGPMLNPAQIFAEPSLLARLRAGQIDATIGYRSAVISQKLPYIRLPPQIDFSTPALAKSWYGRAALTLKGKTAHPSPLVFYATALKDAADPAAAAAFVAFLTSARGQAIFRQYGYQPGVGKPV